MPVRRLGTATPQGQDSLYKFIRVSKCDLLGKLSPQGVFSSLTAKDYPTRPTVLLVFLRHSRPQRPGMSRLQYVDCPFEAILTVWSLFVT